MILNSNHSLTLGSLLLTGRRTGDKSWWIKTLSDDLTWGNPEVEVEEVETFLVDGSLETVSYLNREASITVEVRSSTSRGLAEAEAALAAELGRRNELTWTPPDDSVTGAGEPSVFEVTTSWAEFQFEDLNERRVARQYVLTVRALPHARASQPTTLTVPPPAGTVLTTLIDPCNSTAGWSATKFGGGSATVVATGGRVEATDADSNPGRAHAVTLTRSGLAASVADRRYIRVEHNGSVLALNGVVVEPEAVNGAARWYYCPDETLSTVTTSAMAPPNVGIKSVTSWVGEIAASSAPQDGGATGRQGFRTLQIGGSVRTQGSLEVRAADDLGTVLLYTSPLENSVHSLRKYKSSGDTASTDAATVSGETSLLTTESVFTIPADYVPTGGYQLYARVKRPASGSFSVTCRAESNLLGIPRGESPQFTTTHEQVVGDTWKIRSLGTVMLPPARIGSGGTVRIRITSTGTTLDEAWLFHNDGALTFLDYPAPVGKLLLRDATVLEPTRSVLAGGFWETDIDTFDPTSYLQSWEAHELRPGANNVFLVTTGSQAASVAVTYYKRFHTHVVGDD